MSEDLKRRFGGLCPVCGELLGDVPPVTDDDQLFVRRPSMRLEVCSPMGQALPWRLTVIGRESERFGSNTFSETTVEYVYLMCGNGHYFLESTAWADSVYAVNKWNMVATVGSAVSGKSYLLTRALQQSLHHVTYRDEDDEVDDRLVIDLYAGTPLEDLPLENRKLRYQETLIDGIEMPPTNLDDLRPRDILLNHVQGDILEAIEEILDGNVEERAVDWRHWGTQPAQPIVLRTRSSNGSRVRNGWTCLVDLYGEFFTHSGEGEGEGKDEVGMRDRANLRGYQALVWVIDPLIETQAFDPFAEQVRVKRGPEAFERLVRGSLRPNSLGSTGRDLDRVRAARRDSQRSIARRVTLLDNELMADVGGQVSLMICVSKVDAFWTALKEGAHLNQLGDPDQVLVGVARYLQQVARGADVRYFPDDACKDLLWYVDPQQVVDAKVRRRNMLSITRDLVDFYSDPENFWNLVHGGRPATVTFPRLRGGASHRGGLDGASIRVPSIGHHMDAALRLDHSRHRRGGAEVADLLGLRDLVMSALCCGVMFGLGYGQEVSQLFERDWVQLRFFLCSPLAAAPASRDTAEAGFDPLDGQGFADTTARSASLTQLLLRVMRGVF